MTKPTTEEPMQRFTARRLILAVSGTRQAQPECLVRRTPYLKKMFEILYYIVSAKFEKSRSGNVCVKRTIA